MEDVKQTIEKEASDVINTDETVIEIRGLKKSFW